MESRSVGRIVFILGVTAVLGAPAWAQEEGHEHDKQQKQHDQEHRAKNKEEKRKADEAARQAERAQAAQQQQEHQQAQQADRAQRTHQQEANQQAQQAERQRQQHAQGRSERIQQQRAIEQQQQAAQQQQAQKGAKAQAEEQQQYDQQQQQAQQQQYGRMANREARLSDARQQQLIKEQQYRNQQYKTVLQRQELQAEQRAISLQQARRLAQYRYQQRYVERLRDQRLALANTYDYNNDPYYYTAPSYRYSRAGRSYQTNEYGANLLRQAVNSGYEEGVRAAQADREDGFRGDYRNSYAYQDANYGYNGMYVAQSDYNYYFREGFRRGYEDGYNTNGNNYRYGSNSNGTLGILSTVLATILNLQQLR